MAKHRVEMMLESLINTYGRVRENYARLTGKKVLMSECDYEFSVLIGRISGLVR